VDDTTEQGGIRRLDAAAVNELAQALNDGVDSAPVGRVPDGTAGARQISPAGGESGGSNLKPLESEEIESAKGVFPPDIDGNTTVGGSVEEQSALRDEYRRG
jgi:hypothetical protein